MLSKTYLDKHKNYKKKYGKNEIYWGIGIENEMYLEFENKARISQNFFLNNHKSERYSVDYYKSYKDELLKQTFRQYSHEYKEFDLPILVNSHSFMHCDTQKEFKTTYEKDPKPNKKFNGKTLHEYLIENNSFYKDHYNLDIVYDGDTIEFITQDFYKTDVRTVVNELEKLKKYFIDEIQPIFPFKEFGKINIMKKNHPFAIHLTNMKNVTMFNNGTYHFNFTLPTKLDDKGEIENKYLFIQEHQNAIRLLQLFEPIFITMHGSIDPFYKQSYKFSSASQRCAVSRYIGLGTYNTSTMKNGKILHIKVNELDASFWYNIYHNNSAYKKLDQVGLDINFNKHYYHGIELRIFDFFENENDSIYNLLKFIVHLLDHSLEYESITDFVKNEQWNEMVVNCMTNGKNTYLPSSQMSLFNNVFGTSYNSMNIEIFYILISSYLEKKYKNEGKCSKYMLKKQTESINNCCIIT